jgi:transglutaminase-like putative cysteine protease
LTGRLDLVPTLSLTILTLASAIGLDRVFIGHSWVWPVVACGVAGHVSTWATRHWRLPQPLALLIAVTIVALVGTWTVLGPATHYGIPDRATWRALSFDIGTVRSDFAGEVAPISATPGFRFIAAIGAGTVAVLGDWITFRWRSSLFGAAPAFALFIVCCSSGEGPGREESVLVEVAALLIFLWATRSPGWAGGHIWFAGVRSGALRAGLTTALATGGLAILAVLLVAPIAKGEDGKGALGWRSSIGTGSGGVRDVIDPTANLQTDLIQLGTQPVFQVVSPVSSYWRLTSLDNFDGSEWGAVGSYRGFGTHLPGITKRPPGTEQIEEQFQIEDLDSDWYPLAFNPLAEQGIQNVSFDPTSDSLLASSRTSPGQSYTVFSYEYLSTLNKADLEAAPPLKDLSSLKVDLALPSTVSPAVLRLAQQLVAGQATEYDKAIAIQNYLRSSLFSYSLRPKYDGSADVALYNFLFVTRQGYCQQFAGAYAVLARAVGLPTRLAVGFATGSYEGNDTYQVVDGDAHTWPEVYFGPQYGWIPFEPTKGFSNPTASGVDGTSSNSGSSPLPGNAVPTTAPTTVASSTPGDGTINDHLRAPVPATVPDTIPSRVKSHVSGAWLWALAIAAAGLGWALVNIGARRLRWYLRKRKAAQSGAPAAVLANWADVSELLAWRGLPKRPSETYGEYARRATRGLSLDGKDRMTPLRHGVERLAQLAVEAEFAPDVAPEAADEAAVVAKEVHDKLLRGAGRLDMLRWILLPKPGSSPTG